MVEIKGSFKGANNTANMNKPIDVNASNVQEIPKVQSQLSNKERRFFERQMQRQLERLQKEENEKWMKRGYNDGFKILYSLVAPH